MMGNNKERKIEKRKKDKDVSYFFYWTAEA